LTVCRLPEILKHVLYQEGEADHRGDKREIAMRPVVLHVFDFSLDGIIGEENTGFYEFCRAVPEDPAYEAWLVRSLKRAGVHIMGRITYEGMAQHFPTATDAIADVLNPAPKAVFSRTLQAADWAGTEIISGDTAEEIGALRRRGDGEIHAHGGVTLAQSLARLDLVDEYRLTVYPYVAGNGAALFADLPKPLALELTSSTAFGNGTLGVVYRRRR
jgi:dihydrofolate reductase